jgi:uncharacterized protein YegP (UPF0339 family)
MFELYKDKAGEFRFRLKTKNGIQSVMTNAPDSEIKELEN